MSISEDTKSGSGDKAERTVYFDDYIVSLGEFGRYQKFIYLIAVLPAACVAFAPMSTVFIFGERSFRCSIPDLKNDTYLSQGIWHDDLINQSIPEVKKDGEFVKSECKIYQNPINDTNITTQEKCDHWVYDQSVYKSTVISEMDLVCDDFIYQSHAGMVYFGGLLCGALVMGILADIIGRKPVLCICVLVMLLSNLAIVWIPNFVGYVILRFIAGVVNIGCFDAAFVIGLELVGPSKRAFTGIVIEFIWCIGEAYLLVAAFILRRWRDLQLSFSVPIGIMVLYCWFIPESPRWLISKGKVKKAMKILQKAAKINKVKLPENVSFCDQEENTSTLQFLPLIKSPRLIGRLLISSFNWLIIAMGYFGLTLNTGRLGGDVYLNFLATIIVEFLGYGICLLLMDRIGRRPVLCGSMLLGGVACICTIFTTLYADKSLHWITIVLSNVGKCCVSAAFALVFVFTPEMFPTTNRSFILGLSNMAGRVGGMASPYIASMGQLVDSQFGRALPVIVFGCAMVLSGISALLLPETMNKKLPENIGQAIELGHSKPRQETDNETNFSSF